MKHKNCKLRVQNTTHKRKKTDDYEGHQPPLYKLRFKPNDCSFLFALTTSMCNRDFMLLYLKDHQTQTGLESNSTKKWEKNGMPKTQLKSGSDTSTGSIVEVVIEKITTDTQLDMVLPQENFSVL